MSARWNILRKELNFSSLPFFWRCLHHWWHNDIEVNKWFYLKLAFRVGQMKVAVIIITLLYNPVTTLAKIFWDEKCHVMFKCMCFLITIWWQIIFLWQNLFLHMSCCFINGCTAYHNMTFFVVKEKCNDYCVTFALRETRSSLMA